MKKETKDILLKTFSGVMFVLVLVSVFLISHLNQFFSNSVSDVTGDILWTLIYLIMPIAVFASLLVFRKKQCLAWICLAAYIFIAAGTYFAVHGYLSVFTTEKWGKYTYERAYMLDDFKEKYDIEAMTRDEIIAVLGKPDYIVNGKFNYNIERGWVDPIVLLICFDENETVAECFTYSEFETNRLDTIVSAE